MDFRPFFERAVKLGLIAIVILLLAFLGVGIWLGSLFFGG